MLEQIGINDKISLSDLIDEKDDDSDDSDNDQVDVKLSPEVYSQNSDSGKSSPKDESSSTSVNESKSKDEKELSAKISKMLDNAVKKTDSESEDESLQGSAALANPAAD